ncbi:MAG: hypothetical protein WCO97_09440 [bacterium]
MKSLLLTLTAFVVIGIGIAYAGMTYTYKCPNCGLVQQYDRPNPGAKCPNDGWIMVSQ